MPDSDPKAKLRLQIDRNLKRVYQEALDEEVPDRFKDLLSKLRDKDKLREAKS
ncbi:transcriptional regulator (plasmid) [Pseudorhodobacter turbinis]|uniref:Transcriptional regulator n=1 Tax=Pseudorhodobacter turbinis TaxID=2500533 RepID=A0A4P8EK06_9RHOB|nr:NepR family anti-sigma factor [Pseudorhodobacter turbinis]QCO57202.1 transcriptional regulator [Pseudorhodobacter turbinis]